MRTESTNEPWSSWAGNQPATQLVETNRLDRVLPDLTESRMLNARGTRIIGLI